MISTNDFKYICIKALGQTSCEFDIRKVDTDSALNQFGQCITCTARIPGYDNSERIVAKLFRYDDGSTMAAIYPQTNEDVVWWASFGWSFRWKLFKATKTERNICKIVDRFAQEINTQSFYKKPECVWALIDRITDDVFVCDVKDMADQLSQKADRILGKSKKG